METWNKEINFPYPKDIYSKRHGFYGLRTVTFVKTEREREIGVGEDYDEPAMGFGECLIPPNWSAPKEVFVFKFVFDYNTLARQYNKLAEDNGWPLVINPDNYIMRSTMMPCRPR